MNEVGLVGVKLRARTCSVQSKFAALFIALGARIDETKLKFYVVDKKLLLVNFRYE